jgi:hypothetical protein
MAGFITGTHYNATTTAGVCNSAKGAAVSVTDDCCPFTLNLSGFGPDSPYDALYRFIDVCPIPTGRSVHIVYDFFATNANNLLVATWNGTTCSTLYSTGCTTGSSNVNRVIPAGTTRLVIFLSGCCNCPVGNAGDAWSVTITCN